MTTTCHLCRGPKIVCVYIYPLNGQGGFSNKALEFSLSYAKFPPGLPHSTVVVCNGAPATQPSRDLFNALPDVSFIDHDNSGWDIGGFQLAARTVPADLMVFFGSHTYFRRAGWLARMAEAFDLGGDTLYGATGNQGDLRVGVQPHVRTTAFWCKPELLARYPVTVTGTGGGGARYAMEHGPGCFTDFVRSIGRDAWIVGWNDIRNVVDCDSMPEGFHKG